MNETQNTPELRFEGFTEPWGQRKVADVANRFDNLRVAVTASLRVPGTTPYYGANGIQDYVEGSTHDGEFVLVAEDGANDLKNYPVRFVNGRIWVNNHAHVLQAKSEIADNKYLAYSISQVNIESLLVGGGRAKLNAEALMGINFYLPTFAEQKAIGDYFAAFDSLITLHQCKHERLQHLKQALLRKMFPKPGELVPELRFDGFTEPWEERKFGEEFLFLRNNTLSRAELCDADGDVLDVHYGDVLIKYSSVIDITKANLPRIIDARKVSGCDSLHNGDVVIADTAEDETAGKCTELRGIDNERVFSGLHTIPCRPRRIYAPGFLGHYLNSRAFRKQLFSMMQGTKVVSISKTSMASTCLTVPSIAEQITISETLSSIDSLIDLYRRKYERLLRLKQALLRKMFV